MIERDLLGVVKLGDDLGVTGEVFTEGPQEHGGGHFAGLVDANDQNVLFGYIDLDPGASLGNDAASMEETVAVRGIDDEIDAGRTVQLGDNNPLSTVDDEFTTAEHYGDFTEVDTLFLDLGTVLAQ